MLSCGSTGVVGYEAKGCEVVGFFEKIEGYRFFGKNEGCGFFEIPTNVVPMYDLNF